MLGIYDVNGNLISGGIEIKDYFKTEMETTIDSVRQLMTEPCVVFPLITDIHYLSEIYLADQVEHCPKLFLDSIENIKYFASKVRCDFLANLGDCTDGNIAASNTISLGEQMLESFKSVGLPYFPCIGNHDDNRYYNSGSDKIGLTGLFRGYVANTTGVFFDVAMNGTNYYVDFPNFKIRFIWLNANNNGAYGFSNETASWFTEVALNTPNEYSVVVFGHTSPIASLNANSQSMTNGATIGNAIKNYESATKHVIAYIYGHNHGDGSWVENSFRSVTINSNKFLQGTRTMSIYPSGIVFPDRKLKTASEDCWDVVIIRPASKKINFVRFGAGSDREYSFGG